MAAVSSPTSCSRRTVYDLATGEKMERVEWHPVRGLDGTKEASITIKPHPEGPLHNKDAVTVNIAVANGLGACQGCVGFGLACVERG